jgi:hypothetical protein
VTAKHHTLTLRNSQLAFDRAFATVFKPLETAPASGAFALTNVAGRGHVSLLLSAVQCHDRHARTPLRIADSKCCVCTRNTPATHQKQVLLTGTWACS